MEYDFRAIEQRRQANWKATGGYRRPFEEKFYVLDISRTLLVPDCMSAPARYIASDVFARYKRHQGFNVLHPMGYDSFGLPAEQYAIQTGQHPAITTEANVARYREQLDQLDSVTIGRARCAPVTAYYRWTQWIFAELFESWYDAAADRAKPISALVEMLQNDGLETH